MKSLLILGRQPELGLCELESLYGPEKVVKAGHQAAIVDVDPCLLAFDRLGGSIKFCKLLTALDTTNWADVEEFLVKVSPEQSKSMPSGKMQLGLSLYGFKETPKKIMSTGLSLKKAIQSTGRSVRFIPNKEPELNAAQVQHNRLTGSNGWELVFVKDEGKTIVAQTVKVQNINSYALRDRERPMRDMRVGMLPPKLAQIITNLAVGILPEESRQSICEFPPDEPIPPAHYDQVVLDPFCGTGVILQESRLAS
jgi:tRNA G10  N-methylase Trm11